MSDILELESNTIYQTCVVYYLQVYLKIISVIIITQLSCIHHTLFAICELRFLPIKNVYFKTIYYH